MGVHASTLASDVGRRQAYAIAYTSDGMDKPGVTKTRMWGAYEKVSVRRATAGEGKR